MGATPVRQPKPNVSTHNEEEGVTGTVRHALAGFPGVIVLAIAVAAIAAALTFVPALTGSKSPEWWFAAAGAVAALIAALAALAAMFVQASLTRFSMGIDVLMRYEDKFGHNDHMLELRKAAGEALQKAVMNRQNQWEGLKSDWDNHDAREGLLESIWDNAALDEVMDFFEAVGLLYHRKVLDKEMVWNFFFCWIQGYWIVGEGRIRKYRKERKGDTSYWHLFEGLYTDLQAYEAHQRGIPKDQVDMTVDEVKQFVEDEATVI